MEISQIVFYAVLVVFVFLVARRFLLTHSLKNYSPPEVAEMLKTNSILLLDVRTTDERARNSIKGSMHIPLREVTRRVNELDKHRNREIVCYCASGNRSLSAASTLKKLGFNAANMKGGIAEWNLGNLK